MVVPLGVSELRVEALHQRPSIGDLVKLMHKDARQGCELRAEAEEHTANSSLDLVEQSSKGIRVVEHGPFTAEAYLVLEELAEALLRVRVVVQNSEWMLRGASTLALWTVLALQGYLGRGRQGAGSLHDVPDHGVVPRRQLITGIKYPQPPLLAGADIGLLCSVWAREVDVIVLPSGMQSKRGRAFGEALADLPRLLGRAVPPAAWQLDLDANALLVGGPVGLPGHGPADHGRGRGASPGHPCRNPPELVEPVTAVVLARRTLDQALSSQQRWPGGLCGCSSKTWCQGRSA
mmetsp:Transcript_98046/g.277638  ORF Transcript_98046/g.277638 Transcript_98046/m.277638 type:complete len:291 (+) Transcript_98046:769-1641(+)